MCSPPGFRSCAAGGEVGQRVGRHARPPPCSAPRRTVRPPRPAPRPWCGGSRSSSPDCSAWSCATGMLPLGGVGADHIGPQPRHRFATAARRRSRYRGCAARRRVRRAVRSRSNSAAIWRGDIVQPAGVHHVQRLELAVGIPPFGGHRLEFGDFAASIVMRGMRPFAFPLSVWSFVAGALYRAVMEKSRGQKRAVQYLYPPIDPFDQRMLDVGDGHEVYVEQCGNPDGIPVVVLHGGPGGGCSPAMRRYFDPAHLPHHPVRSARLRPVAPACRRSRPTRPGIWWPTSS